MEHLSDIKNNIETLSKFTPQTNEDIEEWLNKLNLSFDQTVEAMTNIFDNKTLEKDIEND